MESKIAKALGLNETQVRNTLRLLDEGATIPFVSRYRKEMTGGLDEVAIANIKAHAEHRRELEHRKETVLATIEAAGKLTDELRARIAACEDATTLEDLYLPFKPKRKTRAEVARKKGLAPLAEMLMKQPFKDPKQAARAFVGGEVADVDEALQGARDIVAEQVSEDERARHAVRQVFSREAVIVSKVVKSKEDEAAKYRDYFEWSEPLRRCSSHRMLAMRRGEAEGFLRVSIVPEDDEKCVERLERLYVKRGTPAAEQMELAVADAYKRLLRPSIENELAAAGKQKADEEAIRVFAENLKQLLLAAPLGQQRIMGIDPGFRTGCKVVCLDEQGNLLHHEAIFPHPPRNEQAAATARIKSMIEKYKIAAIAIGNGTAGRETEDLVRAIASKETAIFSVSEDGASVYSASKTAREEFPDHDVTVRGAVSIGRRLADPLAELVKIDPKSIGVGQYQHDVNQTRLGESLQQTVESVVNHVGVDVNTASKHILTYVSGLGPALAHNIVNYRSENGAFPNRKALLKVPKMGAKTFEQAAGFLRVTNSDNPLDNSAVHPESYGIVEKMAKDLKCSVADLMNNATLRQKIDLQRYVTDKVGMPTLQDILRELEKPSRDPREQLEEWHFDESVHTIDDLQIGMVLPGIVTNIANFGAFVDIGVHKDGLVHISEMANRRISNPAEVVALHQHVMVKVIDIDKQRGRIQLSLKV